MGKEKIPNPSDKGQARDKAAEMVGDNPHYVSDAKKIEQDAPEILEQVKQGSLSIPQAKKVAAGLRPVREEHLEGVKEDVKVRRFLYVLARPQAEAGRLFAHFVQPTEDDNRSLLIGRQLPDLAEELRAAHRG